MGPAWTPHSGSAYPHCRCHLLQEAIHACFASQPDSGLYFHCLCLQSRAGFQFPEGQSHASSGQRQASFFFDDLQLSVAVFMSVGSSNLKDSSHSSFKYCFSVLPPGYTMKPSHSSHHISYRLFSCFFMSFCLSYSHRGRSVSRHCFTNSNPFWLHLICSAH